MKQFTAVLIICCLAVSVPAQGEWVADSGDKVQVKAEKAIAAFRERVTRTEMYFEQAYAYAIFPSVMRWQVVAATEILCLSTGFLRMIPVQL